MKFQIQREDLLIPLQKIIGAVEKRQTMPALSNILVKADDDQISLTATDLEIELATTLNMVADETGATTMPARKLLELQTTFISSPPSSAFFFFRLIFFNVLANAHLIGQQEF